MNEDKTQDIKSKIPFITEYVVGYRTWSFKYVRNGRGIRLISLFNNQVWPSYKPIKAIPLEKGYVDSVIASDFNHDWSGINAYKMNQYQQNYPTGIMYGAVAMWGKVREYQAGWRSEYAYPLWLLFAADIQPYRIEVEYKSVKTDGFIICLNGNPKSMIGREFLSKESAQTFCDEANLQVKSYGLGNLHYEIVNKSFISQERVEKKILVDIKKEIEGYIRMMRLLRSTYGVPVKIVSAHGGDILWQT